MSSGIDILSMDPGAAAASLKTQEPEARKKAPVEATEEKKAAAPVAIEERRKTEARPKDGDRVELRFALNREERTVMAAAFAAGGDVSAMSEAERATYRQAADRLSKGIDEAMAKNAENRKWVEKAVTEWYASMAQGDEQGPTDLISLLRQAALGKFEGLSNS